MSHRLTLEELEATLAALPDDPAASRALRALLEPRIDLMVVLSLQPFPTLQRLAVELAVERWLDR